MVKKYALSFLENHAWMNFLLELSLCFFQANTSTWTSDCVEANGVPTNGNGTESIGELVIR